MLFSTLAIVSAALAQDSAPPTVRSSKDVEAPTFNPTSVNATKLFDVELSVQWPSKCAKGDEPTVKIDMDEAAIRDGAFLSANKTSGLKISGTANKKDSEIAEAKTEAKVKEDKFTALAIVSEEAVTAGAQKIKFLYFGQKVDVGKTKNTTFKVDLICKGKSVQLYEGKTAPVLKVNSASSAAVAFAAAVACLASFYTAL